LSSRIIDKTTEEYSYIATISNIIYILGGRDIMTVAETVEKKTQNAFRKAYIANLGYLDI
jgi:hypothetical protein